MSEKVSDAPVAQVPLATATSPSAQSVEAGNDATKHADLVDMMSNARRATEKEHNMTLLQGLRLYPKAAAWSMLISCCIVMEGGLPDPSSC
jgi:SP family general alpha glucoside:H+ symporter-like MFS transporter